MLVKIEIITKVDFFMKGKHDKSSNVLGCNYRLIPEIAITTSCDESNKQSTYAT